MHISERIRGGQFISLEFFPPKDKAIWPQFFSVVGELKAIRPPFVSVTYGAGGATQDNTLEIASRLKNEHGLEPLVHLTTVGASRERIDGFLTALLDAGIENVLALRGDPPRGQCDFVPDNEEFQHASDLVTYIKRHFPRFSVGVAGYPEAHPESSSIKSDLDWMRYKVDQGADFVITQLFFDPRIYFDYVDRLAAAGILLPVVPGVLPILSRTSARFILGLCGARIPGKLYLQIEEAHEKGGNEAVRAVGLDFATRQSEALLAGGAPGVHLYTLNQAGACLDIAARLGRLPE
jgi:methylenetetrahydrofolate reductase (NADPH)